MQKQILLFCAISLAGFTNAQCVDEANVYEFTYDGKTYELIKENKNWPDAAECAVERGGGLARIDSEEENSALFEAIVAAGVDASSTTAPDGGGGAYIWLAGTDRLTEGAWIWDINDDDEGDQFWEGAVDGSPVGGLYNNWGDEPDDFGSLQDGAAMSINGWPLGVAGEWNDINDDANEIYFFVEYDELDDSGVEEHNSPLINIHPNPVSEILYVNVANNSQLSQIRLLDVSGKLIETYSENWDQGIDVSNLHNGTYFLEIKLEDGDIFSEKFIK